ncbi:MAG: RNA polymerase sigma factor [Desulfobulbaceae bacterium BRH_c16a]|nr:MAG: RNA polymerase sigma factor [Desulfobulbaceae bacterium BRH_c16a]
MARITCEDCLEKVGKQNRFKLIHLTVQRVKQHRQGEPFLVEGKNKEIVMTLREIAAGKVSFENVKNLPDTPGKPKIGDEDESDSLLVVS